MTLPELDIRQLLIEELQKRRNSNSSYSQRAFAKYLGITSGSLSKIIAGKQGLSRVRAQKILGKISLTAKEKEIALIKCDATWSRSIKVRKSAAIIAARLASVGLIHVNKLKHFRDWRCFTILEALRLERNQIRTAKAAATHLGLTVEEVISSLRSSEALGLASECNGTWTRTSKTIETTNDIPSDILKQCHRDVLNLAIEGIGLDPKKREFQSLVLAFDSRKVEHAKQLIRQFVSDFNNKFETATDSDDVFYLSVNFFPQTTQTKGSTQNEG
jgi:uncharacterized protein (TIGR02147 family)